MVEETQEAFVALAHRIVWCTRATVDRHGRPRSRVVHPIWVREDDRLVGWVITRPTPLKRANLAASPFASASYWDSAHDVAVAECAAGWADDAAPAWAAFRAAAPPLGYDPATIFADGAGAAVIRLDPWRLRVVDARAFAQGRPGLVWRAPGPTPVS
jgi:hypothetical protein